MNIPSDTHPFRETFIVRLWCDDESQANWNGQIQHIRTGKIAAFRDLDELLNFFQNQIGENSENLKLPTKLR